MTPELRRELGFDERSLYQKVVVGLDPGFDKPGCAVYKNGVLLKAGCVKLPAKLKRLDDGERARRVSEAIVSWIRGVTPVVDVLVYERPQIYQRSREASKGDPNNMIKLALVCGTVSGLLNAPTMDFTPGEWSKGLSKTDENGDLYENPWQSPRAILLEKRLKPEERILCEASADAIDAASIVARALGRLDRLFIGST